MCDHPRPGPWTPAVDRCGLPFIGRLFVVVRLLFPTALGPLASILSVVVRLVTGFALITRPRRVLVGIARVIAAPVPSRAVTVARRRVRPTALRFVVRIEPCPITNRCHTRGDWGRGAQHVRV